jgi:guanylate cyclase
MSGPRLAVPWFGAYVGLVVLAEFIQPVFGFDNNLSTGEVALFFVLNIVGVSTIFFVTLHYFVGQRDRAYELLGIEQARSDRLLLNVLPKEIAVILKEEERTIADHIPAMSVLFADMVEFTPISERLSPEEVVHFLNEVFSYFDALSDKYGCEKIRTIGDSYMVACGIPIPRPDHAKALARMAIEMRDYISKLGGSGGEEVQFRFGLNSGPAVAGVIGKAKFHYDVWGDTINTASRMESHGVPGKIQITAATYELLKDSFLCEYRGQIEVKGKGSLQTWFLEAERHDRN